MKTKSILKMLEKSNIKVSILPTRKYQASYKRQILSWFDEEGNAESIYLQNINNPDDISSDLFMGTFIRKLSWINTMFINPK